MTDAEIDAEIERLILNNPIVFAAYVHRQSDGDYAWLKRAVVGLATQVDSMIDAQKFLLENWPRAKTNT